MNDGEGASKRTRAEARLAKLEARVERARVAALSPPPIALRGKSRLLLAVLVVALVGVSAYAIFVRVQYGHERSLNAARSAAVARASAAATDFGSYDYRHLDADFAKVLNDLTPAFRSNYSQVTDQLKPELVSFQGVSTAHVAAIGVKDATTSKVDVIVFLDQSVTKSGSATPQIDRNRLQMQIVRQANGSWLVGELQLL